MLLQLETNQFNIINKMNGGLDKVSYINIRLKLRLRLSYNYCALSAGMKSLL